MILLAESGGINDTNLHGRRINDTDIEKGECIILTYRVRKINDTNLDRVEK